MALTGGNTRIFRVTGSIHLPAYKSGEFYEIFPKPVRLKAALAYTISFTKAGTYDIIFISLVVVFNLFTLFYNFL